VTITVEADPPPIVRIMATTLRRAASDPKLAATLGKLRGVAVFKSAGDPQAVTMRFDRGSVHVERGVATDAGVVIEADLATLNEPDPPKPKVRGAGRHLLFALGLAKVIDPPKPRWQDAVAPFWAFAGSGPGMPSSLLVVDTDTGERLTVGDTTGPPDVELHGPTTRLQTALSGNSVLGEDVLGGKLRMVGRLQHLAVLTGRSLDYLMDGAPGARA
jgi:hypothetical protein